MNNKTTETNNMMFLPQMPDLESIKYYKQAIQVSIHHFYIVDEIEDVDRYLDMINVLKTADSHDTIFIYLNTPGGNLYTSIQIINAIRQSNATVVTSMDGMVASAGTLIFLAGHKHIVNPNCTFMVHNYSHGAVGKGNEVATRVAYSQQYFKKLAKDFYTGFLTDAELEDVINDKDFWMESEEVLKRLTPEKSAGSVSDLMDAINQQDNKDLIVTEQQLSAVLGAIEAETKEVLVEEVIEKKVKKKPAKKAPTKK